MTKQKKILITGAHSYIGESVKEYLQQEPENYIVEIIEAKGLKPIPKIFKGYDVVLNVAGIAHIKETKENQHLYYNVNRDLAIEIANAAKEAGVRQLVLLSSMSVYGLITGHITKNTVPHPVNSYGKSKLQADVEIKKLEDIDFKFACLRPPMVYGKGCKGNYQKLRSFALKSPVFPAYQNQRSMIYIGNLCEFVKNVIDFERTGLFFPQNAEYVSSANLVKLIANMHGKSIWLTHLFNLPIIFNRFNVLKKVFGDLTYEQVDVIDKFGLQASIQLTEK